MIPYKNPPLRIELGRFLGNPNERLVLTEKELGEHVTVLGQIGSGKSRLLQEIGRQIIRQRGGVAMLDPAGDLVEDMELWIAESSDEIEPFVRENVTIFEANEKHAFSIDPQWYRLGTPGDANHHAWLLARSDSISLAILRTCGQDGYNDTRRLARFLRAAIYACGIPLDRHGHHIPLPDALAFVDPMHADYGRLREVVYRRLPPDIKIDFDLIYAADDPLYFTESTISLLRTFFSGVVSAIFSGVAEPFDFRRLLLSRGVLLANLRKGDFLSEHQASALGFFLQSELCSAAELISREQRTAFTVIADEAARFVDPQLGNTLRNSRKWGLSYVLAAQDTAALRYGDTDLRPIILAVPNTQITFQQKYKDDLALLAPTFLYGSLDTTPLLHEEQRLVGHALLPVVENMHRHERKAGQLAEQSAVDSRAEIERRQQERSTTSGRVETQRAEDISGERERTSEVSRHGTAKTTTQEHGQELANQDALRTGTANREHSGRTLTNEDTNAYLSRHEQQRLRARINEQSDTTHDAIEHETQRSREKSHEERTADRVEQGTEDRSEQGTHVTRADRLSDVNATHSEETRLLSGPGGSSPKGSAVSRTTFDRRREHTSAFGETTSEQESHALIARQSQEQSAADVRKTIESQSTRNRHSDERQHKIGSRDEDADTYATQQDRVYRTSVGTTTDSESEKTDSHERLRSKTDTDARRLAESSSNERLTIDDSAKTSESRQSKLTERSHAMADSNIESTVAELQRALADKRAHSTSEATTEITAERNLLLPVNVLIHQPTGQWEESGDQQLEKVCDHMSRLANQECMVRIRERPAAAIRVVDVPDAYGELEPSTRFELLESFKQFLVKKHPSCFVPDLTIEAEQRRLTRVFAALEEWAPQRIEEQPAKRLLALPLAALPAPADSPFEI